MANKAVVGAVALGVCGYTALERFKDWEVEKEREEREQTERDQQAEYIRKHEESLRKKGSMSDRKFGAAVNMMTDKIFQASVYAAMEDILYELAVKVGEEGRPFIGETNLQQLNLPLMGNKVSLYYYYTVIILCTYVYYIHVYVMPIRWW